MRPLGSGAHVCQKRGRESLSGETYSAAPKPATSTRTGARTPAPDPQLPIPHPLCPRSRSRGAGGEQRAVRRPARERTGAVGLLGAPSALSGAPGAHRRLAPSLPHPQPRPPPRVLEIETEAGKGAGGGR